ncbi:MAG TPA: sulfate adenylyltransferase subunit CysN [Bryobacteraceae bacterium]|nr:sulfate adenylyltransferase subunit CysN [Bryobacteraceae bacterium]
MAAAVETISGFDQFLAAEQEKDLLRLLTCGSVDDGKSTLIGRLLYDSRNVFEDQVQAAAKASRNRSAGSLDLSLLTDGLRAEREQGITIDVAYRYFATARRKFIIADTPGHEQYTRNMATGASTADLAILLIDARQGVLDQSRRHAYICSLLGIPRYVVAVNKMDLVDFDRAVFDRIQIEFSEFLDSVGVRDAYFLPMSALAGDNVVRGSSRMPWFQGASLLEHLETVDTAREAAAGFRMAVQRVVRPDHDFRGYAGEVASGTLRTGDAVTVLPSGLRSRVERIATFDGDLDEARVGQAVTVVLADQLDISRGDLLYSGTAKPHATQRFEAQIVWMDARPLDPRKRYAIKHTTRSVAAEFTAIRHRVDIHTLAEEPADRLEMNAIGVVEMATAKPIFFDPYSTNRATGAFIVIDPETNATSGAGMLLRPVIDAKRSGPVTAADRMARWGHRGGIVRVRDRVLAQGVERRLFDRGCAAAFVESDDAAHALESAGMLAIVIDRAAAETDAAKIVRSLELNDVLRPVDRLTQGGGI